MLGVAGVGGSKKINVYQKPRIKICFLHF